MRPPLEGGESDGEGLALVCRPDGGLGSPSAGKSQLYRSAWQVGSSVSPSAEDIPQTHASYFTSEGGAEGASHMITWVPTEVTPLLPWRLDILCLVLG